MKIYAIYCTVNLTHQPGWLHDFRQKHDGPYEFHITLKQMAHIDESDLPKIKHILQDILDETTFSRTELDMIFTQILLDGHDIDNDKGYIYVFADQRNKQLDALQKRIREELADYSDYYFKESCKYEFDFQPHLTIARDLDARAFTQASHELPKRVVLTGKISGIVLSCVNEPSPEEASKPENLTTYPL